MDPVQWNWLVELLQEPEFSLSDDCIVDFFNLSFTQCFLYVSTVKHIVFYNQEILYQLYKTMVVTIPCFFLVCLNSLRCIKLKFTLKKNDTDYPTFFHIYQVKSYNNRIVFLSSYSPIDVDLRCSRCKKKGVKLHLHESDTSGKSINQHCQLIETFEELFNTLMIKKTHRDINVK